MNKAIDPPGPRGQFLLGSLPEFNRNLNDFFVRCARDYGDIAMFRLFGRRAYLVIHPDHIETVLLSDHRNFAKNRSFWNHVRSIFGQGLLTSEGEFWQSQRRLAAPAFHHKRIAAYGEVMVRYTERMVDQWRDDETRDVHEELTRLTAEIVAKTLFDADVAEDVRALGDAFTSLPKEIINRARRPFRFMDFLPLPGNLRYWASVKRLDGLIYRIIHERQDDPADRGDLLSMLMQARDDQGRPMSHRQLRDELVTLFLAGHETTAIALSWTFYLLSQHPEVEAELVAELGTVLGGRPPTVDDLGRLKVTEMVVQESLRLYPPAFVIGREAVADCEIGGYRVPRGSVVFISQWVLHRDPRYFDRPAEFLPQRWADGLSERLPRYVYMPFGGGPRICIGNRFAMLEAMLLLATIAQKYRMSWQRERPLRPFLSITLRPRGGVPMRLSKRR